MYCLCYYSCPNFSPLPPPSSQTPTSIVNHHTIFHVYGSFIYVLWLIPSPSFDQFSPLSTPLTIVSLFHDSMPLILFCSLVYFVHYIPFVSEVLWYSFFTNWLISFSIIVSSSIHAVTKGKNSLEFLLFAAAQYSIV